jgi:hypothetical protein
LRPCFIAVLCRPSLVRAVARITKLFGFGLVRIPLRIGSAVLFLIAIPLLRVPGSLRPGFAVSLGRTVLHHAVLHFYASAIATAGALSGHNGTARHKGGHQHRRKECVYFHKPELLVLSCSVFGSAYRHASQRRQVAD